MSPKLELGARFAQIFITMIFSTREQQRNYRYTNAYFLAFHSQCRRSLRVLFGLLFICAQALGFLFFMYTLSLSLHCFRDSEFTIMIVFSTHYYYYYYGYDSQWLENYVQNCFGLEMFFMKTADTSYIR